MYPTSLALLIPFALAQIASAAVPANPLGWTSRGCYREPTMGRQLGEAYLNAENMTPQLCQNFCSKFNFRYSGVEYGRECWCGAKNPSLLDLTFPGECKMPCIGDSKQNCGGEYRIEVFYTTDAFTGPFYSTGRNGYIFPQCYEDQVSSRTLGFQATREAAPVSVETCTEACRSKAPNGPYKYAGVEFGRECFCSNTKPSDDRKRPWYECGQQECEGKKDEYCGGPDRILVYVSQGLKSGAEIDGLLVKIVE